MSRGGATPPIQAYQHSHGLLNSKYNIAVCNPVWFPIQVLERKMTKSTTTYWNSLAAENASRWSSVQGLEAIAEELTLSIDPGTGEYTRLTHFLPGADTSSLGGKSHNYPEEVFIVSGRLYDVAFGRWLEAGDYASRPPGELHGPFRTDTGCIVLEVSFPNRVS